MSMTLAVVDEPNGLWLRSRAPKQMELALAIQAFIILALLQKFVFSK